MNSLCIFTRKRARVLCIYRFNKRFAWSFFHSHNIINIPRLLGLYGENIGPPGLCSRDPFHPLDDPFELQGEGTSAKFVSYF